MSDRWQDNVPGGEPDGSIDMSDIAAMPSMNPGRETNMIEVMKEVRQGLGITSPETIAGSFNDVAPPP